jgi:predicted outer membrane repeat protein
METPTAGLTAATAFVVGLLVLAALTSKPAEAAGVVGTGDPSSCTEGAFAAALAGGGAVTFDCGASPFTFTLTTSYTISTNTNLHGGGLITLSGGYTVQIFSVNSWVSLTLDSITVTAGASTYAGGAIYNKYRGTLNVTNSTFSDNSASYYGGAIYNSGGTVNVTNSTFSGNSATNYGGAIANDYNNYYYGTVNVTNSTFSGNSATNYGGAIFNNYCGTVNVINSTLSGNSVSQSYGGGAIYNGNGIGLWNTIVANSSPAGRNCGGSSITNGGHNLDSDGSCGVGTATNPKLDPTGLANNGGPTQTIALQAGSPAINAGDNTVCAADPVNNLDQRGAARPGTGSTHCSIGAYEYNSVPSCGWVGTCTPTATPTATPTPTITPTPIPCTTDSDCPSPDTCVSGGCAAPTATPTDTPTAPPTPTTRAVGTGDPSTCTESALDAALDEGGAVTFDCGASPFTLTLTTGKTIAADTTLDGGGLITLSGGGSVQLFSVSSGVTLELDNITVTGGHYNGAIANSGTLTIANSTFSGNGVLLPRKVYYYDFSRGGAISNDSFGTLTISNSTFSGNTGPGAGAIANSGNLTITNSTFSDNSISSLLRGGQGGAISSTGSGNLTITNSTFSGNSAGTKSGRGGAISSTGSGNLTITNSTFSGNSAFSGGAICGSFYGTGTLTNSTFSGNSSSCKKPYCAGAIYNEGGTVTLQNTIVANNAGGNCSPYWGTITDGGQNLRWPSSDSSCVGNFGDPKLAPLADNGGPTWTMALQAGSAAVNGGDNTICATDPVNGLDQRGFARVGGGLPNCSIGAYEYNSGPSCGAGLCVFPPQVCVDGECVTATPTPTSATPTPTPKSSQVSCENAAATNLAKLAACIVKCHTKWTLAAAKAQSFDEKACEMGAGQPVSCRAKYDAATASLVAKGTCPRCLDASAQGSLADSMSNFVEGEINGQIYCAGPVP